MAPEKYSIGGNVRETEAFEAFADIPQNRVLLADKLTMNPPAKPKIKEGLTSIEAVFDEYKPTVEVEFETEQGASRKETLGFKSISDFGTRGVISQSAYLGDLSMKKDQYNKIIKQLKKNKQLQDALNNPEYKKAFIDSLHALIKELDGAK
jgi:hypothetical protein